MNDSFELHIWSKTRAFIASGIILFQNQHPQSVFKMKMFGEENFTLRASNGRIVHPKEIRTVKTIVTVYSSLEADEMLHILCERARYYGSPCEICSRYTGEMEVIR